MAQAPSESSITRAITQFVQDMTMVPVDQPIDNILENALMAEHKIRLLFGSGQQGVQLYLGLIDIFGLHPAARRTRRGANQSTSNPDGQHILPLGTRLQRPDLARSTVFDLEVFQERWELFTHGTLKKMRPQDWNNVLAAGGSVLACLTAQQDHSQRKLNKHFQSGTYASSDIDLFLWGLTPEQAERKMEDIYKAVSAAAPWDVICVRKAKTISIHTTFPYRPAQIVLRLYQSPAEILAGFDIDSSCCAYDGSKVYVNPRALAAIVRQCNTIDVTRRSPSYEYRLAKYAQRGFQIFIPSLNRDLVKSWVYNKNLREFPNGLARLLVLEAALTSRHLYTYLRYPKGTFFPTSDYDSNALGWEDVPYGLSWDAKEIKKEFTKKDNWLNSPSYPFSEGHKHMFVIGSMRQCLRPSCKECDRYQHVEDALSDGVDELDIYVRGPISFITTNPGSQLLTGSFRPIEFDDWVAEAYQDRDEEGIDNHGRSPVAISNGPSDIDEGEEYHDAISELDISQPPA